MRLYLHREGVAGCRDLAKFARQRREIHAARVALEHIRWGGVPVRAVTGVMTIGLSPADEIVVHQADSLDRKSAHRAQERSQRADVPLGDRAVNGNSGRFWHLG